MIFLDVPNKYGYQLDLKDPLVQKLYWRYKDKHHIPHWCPLSDEERLDFEAQVIEWWERRQMATTAAVASNIAGPTVTPM